MSSTLFSIYLNDLAVEINNLNAGVDTADSSVSTQYADDIDHVVPSENKLKIMLKTLADW